MLLPPPLKVKIYSYFLFRNQLSCSFSFYFLVIKEESTESRAEVKSFDHGKLKHVETEEKNPLPTASTLMEEMRPETLPDVSGVAGFDDGKLKHVETEEKNVLPTSDGEFINNCLWIFVRIVHDVRLRWFLENTSLLKQGEREFHLCVWSCCCADGMFGIQYKMSQAID